MPPSPADGVDASGGRQPHGAAVVVGAAMVVGVAAVVVGATAVVVGAVDVVGGAVVDESTVARRRGGDCWRARRGSLPPASTAIRREDRWAAAGARASSGGCRRPARGRAPRGAASRMPSSVCSRSTSPCRSWFTDCISVSSCSRACSSLSWSNHVRTGRPNKAAAMAPATTRAASPNSHVVLSRGKGTLDAANLRRRTSPSRLRPASEARRFGGRWIVVVR